VRPLNSGEFRLFSISEQYQKC